MPRSPFELPIRTLLVFALALSALGASSCSRQLPTAVASDSRATRLSSQTVREDDYANQVVVALVSGADPSAIAVEYGATLLEFESDDQLAVYRPGAGQTTAALAAQLALDARVTTSEENGAIIPAETRQKSFAFDDGVGTLQTTVAQPAAEAIGLADAHRVS
ncbi:MAG: hypothetical protein IT348_04680, partial [Candidatus Eisenbacteria bacterium]|nr:hypothetical protein [Candidatus Eisenbacteria bacterium]